MQIEQMQSGIKIGRKELFISSEHKHCKSRSRLDGDIRMIRQALARRIWSGRNGPAQSSAVEASAFEPSAVEAGPQALEHGLEGTPGDLLQRLADLISRQADEGQRLLDNHAIAANRLDAVGYELARLREEMADVISNGRQRLQLPERPVVAPGE